MLTVKRLDLKDALTMIEGAKAKAEEIGVPMSIAVTDESCNLIAFARMDGTKTPGISLAIDKSFTATGTRKGTHELGAASQPGKPAYGISSTLGGRMVTVGGGLPVIVDGVVVGGIGASSGTPLQDQEVAEAGIQALLASE
ncbi:GlcG/HbpS family heme-binding protein [Aliiruegeria sabulilitoris]|uniref:GlcG/HbpS family heme-binding protein n=1 Tax=Aliiruegeria sabulilitoris TaxID=1510458 RepID=UPI00082E4B6C|nr:heme-binding protein [Aliiruegeria sabulilitoris]NDR59273.1 heme-binding protein [Pseudoruegeria sp. M32A2M]